MFSVDSMIVDAPKIMYHFLLKEPAIGWRNCFDFLELMVLILIHCLWHNVTNHTARLLFYIGYGVLNSMNLDRHIHIKVYPIHYPSLLLSTYISFIFLKNPAFKQKDDNTVLTSASNNHFQTNLFLTTAPAF